MLETIADLFRELHFRYLEQFLTALLPMALTVVIHGQGMGLASRYFKRFGRPPAGSSRIELPGQWQDLGGFEAIAGMLMFGWSTAVLAVVVQKLHSIES
jgi:hypothetical protein